MLALLLALIAATPASPDIEIVAPERAVMPGKNIRLSVKPEKVEGFASIAYTWVISPPVDDLDEWPDHTHISFGAGLQETEYHVTLVASFVTVGEDKAISQIQTKTETIVSVSTPPPLPKPTPVPPPEPDKPKPVPPKPGPSPITLPDGKYKLAQYMYDLCKKMPPAQCKALADALSGIAKNAREGSFRTKGEVIVATKDADSIALGTALDSWKPLLDHLAATVNTMKTVIVTPADCAIAWEELAMGLYAIQ